MFAVNVNFVVHFVHSFYSNPNFSESTTQGANTRICNSVIFVSTNRIQKPFSSHQLVYILSQIKSTTEFWIEF